MAALALALLVIDIAISPHLDGLRGKSYDIYQLAAPPGADLDPVVLVEIDDDALARHGRWPWPRSRIAELVEAIGSAGPKVLGIDILFPEQADEPGDAALAAAIRKTSPVLAMSLTENATTNPPAPLVGWSVVGETPQSLTAFPGLLASRPEFNSAAGGLGMVRSVPDQDGVTRSVPMIWAVNSEQGVVFWPAMAMELVRLAMNADSYTVRLSEKGYSAVRVGERIVDLTAGGAVWLTDTREPITRLGASQVLEGGNLDMLGGRIVILSVSATGFDSFHNTPLFATRPGAEIHALLAAQLLQGRFPYEPANAKSTERVTYALLAALMIAMMVFMASRPLALVIVIPVVLLAPFALGFIAFEADARLFDFLRPTAGLAMVGAGSSYFLYRAAEDRRQMISGQFAQYLSPNVVERLINSDSNAGQSAERRDVTVMFMDMRGFTAASERLAPEEIVIIINRFLTIASEEIFRTEGTIDKFMGDAVMAFWNAPLDQPDHAERALDAVRGIYRRVGLENAARRKDGLDEILLGTGVESGECSVGNFGSDIRYNYTVIGQSANLASRLETATKAAGVMALAGPDFARRLPQAVVPAGRFDLAGIAEPVAGFRILLQAD